MFITIVKIIRISGENNTGKDAVNHEEQDAAGYCLDQHPGQERVFRSSVIGNDAFRRLGPFKNPGRFHEVGCDKKVPLVCLQIPDQGTSQILLVKPENGDIFPFQFFCAGNKDPAAFRVSDPETCLRIGEILNNLSGSLCRINILAGQVREIDTDHHHAVAFIRLIVPNLDSQPHLVQSGHFVGFRVMENAGDSFQNPPEVIGRRIRISSQLKADPAAAAYRFAAVRIIQGDGRGGNAVRQC